MTRGYFLTSGIHNDIEICKTFFIEKNQMSKIQINDLDDLNVEQFATLTDLEAAGIQGGLTVTEGIAGLTLVLGAGVAVGAGAFAAPAVLAGVAGIAFIDLARSLTSK
jgi:hypothetical protein